MEAWVATMKGSGSALREHRPSKLDDLCLDSPDRGEEDGDDSNISPLLSEEFLCKCEDDIGIILLDFRIRESEKDKRYKRQKEEDKKYHRVECCTSWSDTRIFRFLGEIHRNIPSIVEKYSDKRSRSELFRTEGKWRKPIPWERVYWSGWEVYKSEDNNREEDDSFDDRQANLHIACKLNPFDNHEGNKCQPESGNSRHPRDIIHKIRGKDEEGGIGRRNRRWDHKDTTEDQKGPSSKKSNLRSENPSHPGKWSSCIGLKTVEVDESPSYAEHNNPTGEDTRRWERPTSCDNGRGGRFDREGRSSSRYSHYYGFSRSESIFSKFRFHSRE